MILKIVKLIKSIPFILELGETCVTDEYCRGITKSICSDLDKKCTCDDGYIERDKRCELEGKYLELFAK
jgi:hypothetical protein